MKSFTITGPSHRGIDIEGVREWALEHGLTPATAKSRWLADPFLVWAARIDAPNPHKGGAADVVRRYENAVLNRMGDFALDHMHAWDTADGRRIVTAQPYGTATEAVERMGVLPAAFGLEVAWTEEVGWWHPEGCLVALAGPNYSGLSAPAAVRRLDYRNVESKPEAWDALLRERFWAVAV